MSRAPSSSSFVLRLRLFSSSRFSAVSYGKLAVKNRMVVPRNRRPPRMHPGCTDPLLKNSKAGLNLLDLLNLVLNLDFSTPAVLEYCLLASRDK